MARKKLKKAQHGTGDVWPPRPDMWREGAIDEESMFVPKEISRGGFDINDYGGNTWPRQYEGMSGVPRSGMGKVAARIGNIFRSSDKDVNVQWKRPPQERYVPQAKTGGEVLNSFKSAARFDQPKFKNGRRTKG